MGCAHSSGNSASSKAVEKKLKETYNVNKGLIKLLMLGTGESGKSTFVKQIYNLHGSGYTESEKTSFLLLIRANIVQCIITIVQGMRSLQLSFEDASNEEKAESIMKPSKVESINSNKEEIVSCIQAIVADSSFSKALEYRNKFQLMDSFDYYMEDITKYFQDGYSPSPKDIVAARSKTTGIQETKIEVNSVKIALIDVGGQRGERRKWIHCFDDVNAVLFVTALSEFDLLLFEDNTTNRMVESLNLFGSISNNTYFVSKPMMLFLNKEDIFKEKIAKVTFSDFFPDYQGKNTEQEVKEFIIQKFLKQIKNANKKVYTHVTTATNPDNVKLVFKSVLDITVTKNLQDVGLV